MPRLLFLALALSLMITVLLFSARTVGLLDQPSSVLRNYQCSPQPCWHQIYPGTTSIEQAKTIIRSDNGLKIDEPNSQQAFDRMCWINTAAGTGGGCLFGDSDGDYLATRFPESPYHAGTLTFGDAVSLFGPPTGVMVCYNMTDEHQIFVALYFQGSILASGQPFDLSQLKDRISFDTTVDEIDYHFKPISKLSVWKGFVPISRIHYC